MKNEKGSTVLLVLALLGLGLVVVSVGFVAGYVGYRNAAQSFEVDIPAQYTEMQNVYDNGWKKVIEVAQVPALQAEQVKSVYDGVMRGRYGANGSKAFIQVLREQNPTLDPSLYTKIQSTIEGFHDNFQASQTNLIARKQEYNKFITATTQGLVYNWIGNYPHIRIGIPVGTQDDYQIVTSDKTQEDFKSHKSEPLDLKKVTK